jgi:hypothetical protein
LQKPLVSAGIPLVIIKFSRDTLAGEMRSVGRGEAACAVGFTNVNDSVRVT